MRLGVDVEAPVVGHLDIALRLVALVLDDAQALGLGLGPGLGHLGLGVDPAQRRVHQPLDVAVVVADLGQGRLHGLGVVDEADELEALLDGDHVLVDQAPGVGRQLEQPEPLPHVTGGPADALGQPGGREAEFDQPGHGQGLVQWGQVLSLQVVDQRQFQLLLLAQAADQGGHGVEADLAGRGYLS
jgi:hypothetical protein